MGEGFLGAVVVGAGVVLAGAAAWFSLTREDPASHAGGADGVEPAAVAAGEETPEDAGFGLAAAHTLSFEGDALVSCVEHMVLVEPPPSNAAAERVLQELALERSRGGRPGECPSGVREPLGSCSTNASESVRDGEATYTFRFVSLEFLYTFRDVFGSQARFRECVDSGGEWWSRPRTDSAVARAELAELD